MRVAINTQTATGQKSGFGWYVASLLEQLPRVADDLECIEIAPKASQRDLSTPRRFWWDQVGFPRAAARQHPDLLHQPCFSVPILTRQKVVVSIHDIIPTLFPKNLSLPSQFFFGRFMPFSFRFADAFIASSEHTKNDLVKHLGMPAERIRVIPLAANHIYRPLKDAAEREQLAALKKRHGITDGYFLHVGTIEPRKNLPFLIKAFAEAKVPQQLVIAGKKGWWYEELLTLLEPLGTKVVLTGYLADAELPLLYAGANTLLFPSLYEGFGLPPLEAMQSGTPVLASNASSVPEVVGEAGILLSPTDQTGWVKAIREISGSTSLRTKLSRAGLEQAKKFSWERTARETVEVYRQVLQ